MSEIEWLLTSLNEAELRQNDAERVRRDGPVVRSNQRQRYCTVESESALFRPLATLYCVLSGYANRQLEVSPNGVCDDVASSLAYGKLLLGHTTTISRE